MIFKSGFWLFKGLIDKRRVPFKNGFWLLEGLVLERPVHF